MNNKGMICISAFLEFNLFCAVTYVAMYIEHNEHNASQ